MKRRSSLLITKFAGLFICTPDSTPAKVAGPNPSGAGRPAFVMPNRRRFWPLLASIDAILGQTLFGSSDSGFCLDWYTADIEITHYRLPVYRGLAKQHQFQSATTPIANVSETGLLAAPRAAKTDECEILHFRRYGAKSAGHRIGYLTLRIWLTTAHLRDMFTCWQEQQ